MQQDTEDILRAAVDIANAFPSVKHKLTTRPRYPDLSLVATALSLERSKDGLVLPHDYAVVTGEELGKETSDKVPNLCARFDIERLSLEGMMLREGWSY